MPEGRSQWDLLVFTRGLVSKPQQFLEPVSPFVEPPEHQAAQVPSPEYRSAGRLVLNADTLMLSPGTYPLAVDGAWLTTNAELHHGALLDLVFPYDSPLSVQVLTHQEPAAPLPDDAVVAVARTEGAFVITGERDGRIEARLAGGKHSLQLDSLSWLKRILSSPLQARLNRLELELWHPDPMTTWEEYTREHVELARLSPFEVRLLPRRRARAPAHHCRLHAPQAVFPLEGWAQVPLVEEDGVWVLRRRREHVAFTEGTTGLEELRPDGEASGPTPFFTPVRQTKERWPRTLSNFMLLPGPSEFLSGRRRLGAGPLMPAAIAVFADQLIEAGDVAGPLLVAASAGSHSALASLWQPYVRTSAGEPPTLCLEGQHVCGFFEEAALVWWVQFENDLPVLATHPMAQRLAVLHVRDEPRHFSPTPERLARIRAALVTTVERVKPHFGVTFMGRPIEG